MQADDIQIDGDCAKKHFHKVADKDTPTDAENTAILDQLKKKLSGDALNRAHTVVLYTGQCKDPFVGLTAGDPVKMPISGTSWATHGFSVKDDSITHHGKCTENYAVFNTKSKDGGKTQIKHFSKRE